MRKLLLTLLFSTVFGAPALGQSANGRVTASNPTYVDATTAPLSIDTDGSLRVQCLSGCSGSGGTASDFADTFPTAGTAIGFSDGTNMQAGFLLATQADNVVNTVDGIVTTSLSYIFDGATWDRWTGTVAATQSGTWDEVGINDSGNTITVDASNLDVQIGGSDSLTIGTFPDNEPLNVAQINGVTPLMGAGNTGTGSPRVTISTDQAALTGLGVTATGAATSANAILLGARSDGGLAAGTAALQAPIICRDTVAIDTASSGNVELVALTASETIYVCGLSVIASGTTSVQLIWGTGTACATNETNFTGPYALTAQAGLVMQNPFHIFTAEVSEAVCIENSAAVQISGHLHYTKF